MTTRSFARAALLVGALWPAALFAQHFRTLDVGRQRHDTAGVTVRVDYGAGKLALRAGTAPMLYQMSLRYDGDLTEPQHSFDVASRTLTVGTSKGSLRFSGGGDEERGSDLKLALGPSAPVDLALDLGAVDADLDLSRIPITRLKLDARAAGARVRFDVPNPVPMQSLDVDVGAAGIRIDQLANANARQVRVKASAGGAELDLGGTWTNDMDLAVEIVLGGMSIHVPSDVGVELTVDRIISSVKPQGLTRRGDVYVSDNWKSARHHVRIRARAVLGSITVDQTAR